MGGSIFLHVCRCNMRFLIFALLVLIVGAGCEPPKVKAVKNPKVIVTEPVTGKVMDYQDFTGRLEAVKSIEIRARVSGYVIKAIQARDEKAAPSEALASDDIKVKEGDFVKEGELLFLVEEKPYKVELDQVEANYKLAIAERNLMTENADRARRMWAKKAMSQEDYQRDLAAYEKSVAQVGAVEAMKAKAQMYMDYTRVKAPVSGRISRRFVDPGNLITADNTILTTIVAEDPVYAYFDVDERTYLDLLATVAPGQKSWYEGLKLPVMMRLANENEFEKVGEVDFVDNRVTASTGTVRMRGVFKNATGLLKAGLFVRIRLPVNEPYTAVLISDEAIQSDQERKYVWIVNAKNEAEYRSVKLGQAIKQLRVIRPPEKGMEGKEGLALGERVVIAGMQRVRSGLQVDVEDAPSPTPPEMPLVRLLQRDKVTR
jgi:RND family efflux transporter MFP subunit